MKRRSLSKLKLQLDELERSIESFESISTNVSAATIGWHIEHCLLIFDGVLATLGTSDPSAYKRKVNFTKMFIFAIGRFPRGKVQAPKVVQPAEFFDRTSLTEHLLIVRTNMQQLETMDGHVHFKHPIFGNLRLRESIYFLELHTEHHLKIMREIMGS